MLKYNKSTIAVVLFCALLFFISPIVLIVFTNDAEALFFMIPVPALIIYLLRVLIANSAVAKYDNAMSQKNYDKADEIISKYVSKYKWFIVLKINLLLIKGESELYLYYYNNCNINLDTEMLKYYNYLFQVFKVYYDLISGNQIDLTKVKNIQGIKPNYIYKVCCEVIEKYTQGRYDEALDLMKKTLLSGGEFLQYIYAYVTCACLEKLQMQTTESLEALKRLSYDEYLKQITNNLKYSQNEKL